MRNKKKYFDRGRLCFPGVEEIMDVEGWLDNDEISVEEEGFLRGWLEEEDVD